MLSVGWKRVVMKLPLAESICCHDWLFVAMQLLVRSPLPHTPLAQTPQISLMAGRRTLRRPFAKSRAGQGLSWSA